MKEYAIVDTETDEILGTITKDHGETHTTLAYKVHDAESDSVVYCATMANGLRALANFVEGF